MAKTPAAAPAAPIFDTYEVTSNDVILFWKEPENNGSNIIYYNIEYLDNVISTNENILEYTIDNLMPESIYKFKIQAVNEIGPGSFSPIIRVTTKPLPPKPPNLECIAYGHNFLKLKWGDGKNLNFTRYYLEMYNLRAKEFQYCYTGTNLSYKVNKLHEQCLYTFRICAETDHAGTGDFSDEFIFKTNPALPNLMKSPRILYENYSIVNGSSNNNNSSSDNQSQQQQIVHNNNYNSSNHQHHNHQHNHNHPHNSNHNQQQQQIPYGLTLEWQHNKVSFTDTVEYVLQYSKHKEQDFKQVNNFIL